MNGKEGSNWSSSQHLKALNWLNFNGFSDFSKHKMTHCIINNKNQEELYEIMKNNNVHVTRNNSVNKLGAIPWFLTQTRRAQLFYWSQAYTYL